MNELYSSLLELHAIDQEIAAAEANVAAFEPRMAELRAPVDALQRDADDTRAKLEDLRKQQRKLDHGLNNKKDRMRIFSEKAEKALNEREEAAARTELDFIKRAVEAEQVEADDVNEQARRLDMKLDDLERAASKTREDLQPRVDEMEAERKAAQDALAVLQDKRTNQTARMDKNTVRIYDRVRTGKRRGALAPLTEDGACGSCYNVLPPQEQSEIRRGESIRRCEACGVILYAQS